MKVALARAIVHTPKNLLLDEPTNGLDIPSARGFKTALRRMRDEGTCIILSSHIIHDVVDTLRRGRDHRAEAARSIQGDPAAVSRTAGCATLEEAFMVLTGRQEDATCLAV